MAEVLGEGVTARAGSGELVVTSERLLLPWHARRGKVPGTAVFYGDTLFEAQEAQRLAQGWRWRLLPWREGEVIRGSFDLSHPALAALAALHRTDRERAGRSRRLRWLLPVAGLAPAAVQQRWAREIGFPVGRAMVASSLLEILPGGIGVVQLATLQLDGWFLPPLLRWLAFLGPLLLGEGLLRLGAYLATGQPVGSLLGLLLSLGKVGASGAAPPPSRRPTVVARDGDTGTLVLASPILRGDWAVGGVLPFQGGLYELVGLRSHHGSTHYHFRRIAAADTATLSLAPPPPPAPPAVEKWGGFTRTAFKTVAFCFAPARQQEEWAIHSATSPLLLTRASAACETLGGLVNLLADLDGGSAWWLLDTVVLADGVVRLATSLAGGTPVGSLLGLPLLPLYRRWLKPSRARRAGD